MSEEEVIHRERDPQVDFIKLQLLMVVNQLRTEILMLKDNQRKILDKILNAETPKDMSRDVTIEVVSIRDRVVLLLEIAKNLLRHELDKENREYQEFEDLVKAILNIRISRLKKFGLQKKVL